MLRGLICCSRGGSQGEGGAGGRAVGSGCGRTTATDRLAECLFLRGAIADAQGSGVCSCDDRQSKLLAKPGRQGSSCRAVAGRLLEG